MLINLSNDISLFNCRYKPFVHFMLNNVAVMQGDIGTAW
jgi:hypothetical protein